MPSLYEFRDSHPNLKEAKIGQFEKDHGKMLKTVTQHPVPCAEEYRRETSATFRHLYGLSEDKDTKTTQLPKKKKMGVFGRPQCVMSVNECNGKGWMHNHALLNTMLPAWILHAAAGLLNCTGDDSKDQRGVPELADALHVYFSSTVKAELPANVHKQQLLRNFYGSKPYPAPWFNERSRSLDDNVVQNHTNFAAERVNVHCIHGTRYVISSARTTMDLNGLILC